MTDKIKMTRTIRIDFVKSLFIIILTLAFTAVRSNAQSSSITDARTPVGLAPGAPAGSYPLSALENINLYNGNLNFRLPLLGVGARGEAGYTITFPIEQRWDVTYEWILPQPSSQRLVLAPYAIATWQINNTSNTSQFFEPGRMEGRRGILQEFFSGTHGDCSQGSATHIKTRIIFTWPDGTEVELIDQLTGGSVYGTQLPCDGLIEERFYSRGRNFVSRDGSGITFISDTDIVDDVFDPNHSFNTTGHLLMPDGSRYRIRNGLVDWIRDSNGNKTEFIRDNPINPFTLTRVKDSIGRLVTFSYSLSYHEITFKGFGGAPRSIKIYWGKLEDRLLQPTHPLPCKDILGLFPLMRNFEAGVIHPKALAVYNPTLPSHIVLPDGKTYQFYYNYYGELTRVVLPTGGAYEYEWGGFNRPPELGGYRDDGFVDNVICRRVLKRRVYSSISPTPALESETVYSDSYTGPGLGNVTSVVVEQYAPGQSTPLAKSKHYFHSVPHIFAFNTPTIYTEDSWDAGREYLTEHFGNDGTSVLKRVDNTWQQGCPLSPAPNAVNGSAHIAETVTSWLDTNLIAKKSFTYDCYNQPTEVREHGFGIGAPGPLLRRRQTSYLTNNPWQGNENYATNLNIHIRDLPTQVSVFDGNGAEFSRTSFYYDVYDQVQLQAAPNIVQHDGGFHAGYGPRGNLVKITKVAGFDPFSSVDSYFQYDIAGNVVKTIDENGNSTFFEYLDRFGVPDGEARANSGAPELGGQLTYAFQTKETNLLGQVEHVAYAQYDYYLGKPVNNEDQNGVVHSISYNDPLDRTTQEVRASNIASLKNQSAIVYNDAARAITTTRDRDNFGDNLLKSEIVYDGLGRTIESRQYETTSSYIVTSTVYDAIGRASRVSNPRRLGEPLLWTTTDYDALSRVTRVTTPDGANADMAYDGNQQTFIDQAGKKRWSVTDALGRLVKVTEDPDGLNDDTIYEYDVLDNLRYVNQGGQERWFAYDSLSRMIRAKNPEQDVNPNPNLSYIDPVTNHDGWSMAYSYYPNGNLLSKTDARNTTATYTYDELDRPVTTTFAGGVSTPQVKYFYDQQALPSGAPSYDRGFSTGRMVAVTYGGGSEGDYHGYDQLGRVNVKYQRINTTNYPIQAAYNRAGMITSLTYPSGRIANYSYDQAGRTLSFTGNLGDGVNRNYATGMQYDATGATMREQFGTATPLYHRRHYNNRQQLFDIRLGTDPNPSYDSAELAEWANAAGSWNRGALRFYYATSDNCHVYGNGGTSNNGNILRIDHHVPLDDGVNNSVASIHQYNYDSLNRLQSVTEIAKGAAGENDYRGVFRQAFLYDRWGNRTIDQANTTGPVNRKAYRVNVASSNNRLEPPAGSGTMHYDAAGNLVRDDYTSGTYQEFVYDAENRMVGVKNSLGSILSSYIYDAGGQRVRRVIGGQETWQVYGMGGELLAEYAAGAAPGVAQREYGYRNGQALIIAESGSGGGTSLVKPASQSGADTGGQADPGMIGAASGLFVVDESFAALGLNKGYSLITADISDSDNTGSLVRGGRRTTAEEYGNAPYADDIGGELLAGHPAGAQPAAPQMEYRNRRGPSIVPAQSGGVISVSHTAYQPPDPGQGMLAVDSPSNTGYSHTTQLLYDPRIKSRDAAGNLAVSRAFSITTAAAQPQDTTPPTVTYNYPAAGATIVNVHTYPIAKFSELPDLATVNESTFELRDPSNALVPATVIYIASIGAAQLQPTAPLAQSTRYTARVRGGSTDPRVKDPAGNALAADFTWSFTTEDRTPPTIISYTPAPAAIVNANANVIVTFSEAMDASTVTGARIELRGPSNALVPATVSYNPATFTAVLDPNAPLAEGTIYTARVKGGLSGVKDVAANAMAADVAWAFTIGPNTTPPTVVSFNPVAGATSVNANANVIATFSEAMNAATINGTTVELRDPSNVLVSATVSYNAASSTATLDPTASLAPGTTYTAHVRGGGTDPRVKDVAGNALASTVTWTFTTAQTGSGGIKWLVTDHLGSTRMVVDETGSLAGVRRHDYAPFGEELIAGVGIRGPGVGYSVDSVRQKFTGYERDEESGLDYAEGRYFSSTQGRFTGFDRLYESAKATIPQSWNRYTYALNNPVIIADPSGLLWYMKEGSIEPVWFDGDPPDKSYKLVNNFVINMGDDGWLVLDPKSNAYAYFEDEHSARGAYLQLIDPPRPNQFIESTLEVFSVISGGGAAIKVGRAIGGRIIANRAAARAAAEKAAARKATQLAINKAAGDMGEEAVKKQLLAEGNVILGRRVGARVAPGKGGLRVIDWLVQTPKGEIVAIEVKAYGGTKTAQQVANDAIMATQGAKLVGKNAPAALKGKTQVIQTIERRWP